MSLQDKVDLYLLAKKDNSSPEIAEKWLNINDLYYKKQWHQLTLQMKELMHNESFTKDEDLLRMYENFIREFEQRIDPLSLVEIVLPIARSHKDHDAAVKFLESIEKVAKNSAEATLLCSVGVIELKLAQKDKTGRCTHIHDVRELIEQTEKRLDALPGVTAVHGEFFKMSSTYHREVANYDSYYKEALRYLGCIDLDSLSGDEKTVNALCLGLAALLAKNVYNFGELLAHPILESLRGTAQAWLLDLLFAFNAGDLEKFEKLRAKWTAVPELNKQADFIENKIRLLCLMEMAFARSGTQRQLKFDEIAKTARVPSDGVENLVMRALSLDLVRGSIDQVDGCVSVSWVQPRVLDKKQIAQMANRMQSWAADVQLMENLVESSAKEILTRE